MKVFGKIQTMLFASLLSLILISCAGMPKSEAYYQLYREKPVSILIMPPVNLSYETDMNDIYYSMLLEPLAEAGYYVFPPHFSKELFDTIDKSESFIASSVKSFGEDYGVDMVLFTRINHAYKSLLFNRVSVDVDVIIRSAKTDEYLFKKNIQVSKNTAIDTETDSMAGILMDLAFNVISTVTTSYEGLVRDTGDLAVKYLPKGPYHPDYLADLDEDSGPEKISRSKDYY